MRAAGAKLKKLYGTQLGQDTIETLAGGAIAAGGQALFTDMTPEEIAITSILGIGAATVGRPLGGRAGEALGNYIHRNHPVMSGGAEDIVEAMVNHQRYGAGIKTKLAPYANLNAPAQLGQVFGRGYGDNIAQGLVALGAPLVMGGEG